MEAVRAYLIDTDGLDSRAELLLPRIHARYRERYRERKLPRLKNGALGAGFLLHAFAGIGPEDDLLLTEQGRPFCPGKAFFSLSHSDGFVLLACSDRLPVGADIERVGRADARTLRKVSDLPGEKMSPPEITQVWTRVEAALKQQGTGFYADPKLLDFSALSFAETVFQDHCIAVAAAGAFTLELSLAEFAPGCGDLQYTVKTICRKDSET